METTGIGAGARGVIRDMELSYSVIDLAVLKRISSVFSEEYTPGADE